MALGFIARVGPSTTSNTVITSSGTLNPISTSGFLAFSVSRRSGADPTDSHVITGASQTWDKIATVVTASGFMRVSLHRCRGTGAAAGQITLTCGETQTELGFFVTEITGITSFGGTNLSGNIVQVNTNTGASDADDAVTLAAFADAVNNAAWAGFFWDSTAVPGAGSGLTQIDSGAINTVMRMFTERQVGQNTAPNATEASATNFAGIAAEIAIAAGAAIPVGVLAVIGGEA